MSNINDTRETSGWKVSTSQLFYKYGLLCSTHPKLIILITLSLFSFTCYPVLNYDGFRIYAPSSSSSFQYHQTVPPHAIVQQIIVKSAVIPWESNLILMDAVRAPLAQVFSLLEFVSNFRIEKQNQSKVYSLNDVCLQINEPIANSEHTASNLLPRFSCLVISPANIWKNDLNKFLQDSTIIKTIFGTKDFGYLDSGNLREILFGVPWMETGIRPIYVRNRQRTITYAITLVYSKYNRKFISALAKNLRDRYPVDPFFPDINDTVTTTTAPRVSDDSSDLHQRMTYLHFHNEFSLIKSPALIATYIMLFFYIYFSVRKIDLIKCKWALAVSSLLTIILCLLMSLGICSWFDFNPPLKGREILPYLVVIISLENMLVLTQSIIASPAHLDVKVRVAQGLSKGGQSLLINLAIELGLLTFGYFTFIPVIQEYCLFGMIGLISDFFLQFTFFTALLTVDIQRVGYPDRDRAKRFRPLLRRSNINGLNDNDLNLSAVKNPQNSAIYTQSPKQIRLPKRLRLVRFWTQTRLVHRLLMVGLVVWIAIFLFRSGIVEQVIQVDDDPTLKHETAKILTESLQKSIIDDSIVNTTEKSESNLFGEDNSYHRIKHSPRNPSDILSPNHWFNLFAFYNISLSGKYISFLPPMHISLPVGGQAATKYRHPSDRDHQRLRHFLYPGSVQPSYYDQNDDLDEIPLEHNRNTWTPREIILALLLSTPTLICIVYVFILMYKCMCSRRYDEWRSSWSVDKAKGYTDESRRNMYDYMLETILMKREAHNEEIELIACNEKSPYVAVCSMNGNLTVCDALSGQCHLYVDRSTAKCLSPFKKSESRTFKPQHKPTGSFSSDSTYGSCSSTSGDGVDQVSISDSPPAANSYDIIRAGYNFAPFYSRINSHKNHLSELIVNAASTDIEEESKSDIPASLKYDSSLPFQQIWCMDVHGRYILIGCERGRLEIWDSLTGHNYHHEENKAGITVIKSNGNEVVLGRLDGALETYQIVSLNGYNESQSREYYQTHTQSYHCHSIQSTKSTLPSININLIYSLRAHSQPISSLQLEASHVITGGADHLIKVFKLETGICIYNLHGHIGGVTCLEVDKTNPNSALSGCKGGQVCLWDLATGTCFFNLEAHRDAAVTALSATPLYVISAGTDNRINIWDKYSGNLVNSIPNQRSFYIGLIPLTPNFLITAKDDHLSIWNLSDALPLRIISLSSFGDHKKSSIKNLKVASISRAVICDYGNHVCIIHFPGLTRKSD